jgi:hypothetical protein
MITGTTNYLRKPKISTQIPSSEKQFFPTSLALLSLKPTSESSKATREAHTRMEAEVAVSIVVQLLKCFKDETIFVAAPHRVQVQAVRALLSKQRGIDELVDKMEKADVGTDKEIEREDRVRVDTVERLQGVFYFILRVQLLTSTGISITLGSEASFVIPLFSHTHLPSLNQDLKFLLERRRLNVAISRAKNVCIMISSEEVLIPSLESFEDKGSVEGSEYLKGFEMRAWKGRIAVDV